MLNIGANIKLNYAVVFLVAASLYILTCAPGLVWQDSGLIQYRAWHGDIEGRLGLALAHPLYYLIAISASKIPLGEFAYRINVVNATISALAIANLFLLLRVWLGRTFPALLGAATLALSHTFWWHSTVPETYGLAVALLLCELLMLLQYAKTEKKTYLYLLAFVNGLAIANHMLASIAFVCYFVLVIVLAAKKQVKLMDLLLMLLLWIAAALPYEYLIVKGITQTGDFWGTLSSAVFGQRWRREVLNVKLSMDIIKDNFKYLFLNFPTPNILLFFVGLFSLPVLSPKRWFSILLTAMMILYLVFAFRYTVVDRYSFFIPFYSIVSIFVGLGAHRFSKRNSKVAVCILTVFCLFVVPVYTAAPKIAEKMKLKIDNSRESRKIPYRNDYTYFLRPWKNGYRGAEKFAFEAISTAQRPSIIYADTTTAPPLLYVQEVLNNRQDSDVKIISDISNSENSLEFNEGTIEDLLIQNEVYVVSRLEGYCPDFLLLRYDFEQKGVLWRIIR